MSLLRHGIAHHAIDSDDCQSQSQAGEHGEERQIEARTGVNAVVENFLDGPDFGDGLIVVDGINLVHHGASHSGGVSVGQSD